MERFESELGDVRLTESYFERTRSGNEWKDIEEESEELADKLHFSQIEDLRMRPEAEPPYVEAKSDGAWRKIYFAPGEDVADFFRRLEYLWKSFRQRES
ncbi:MAG: hypothetical protein ABEJ98_04880 [Candidatus Nanohaloarchaea archaeon]